MAAARVRRVAAALAAAVLLAAVPAGCAAPPPNVPDRMPAPTAGALTRADVDAWLDGVMAGALEQQRIAGATVAVVKDGQVLTLRGYGYADTGSDTKPATPVDPESTLFRVGSISKLFTASAVMQLVEAGRLDLDANVQDYLDFQLQTRFPEPVTLRTLLTHTAGFEERLHNVLIPADRPALDLRTDVSEEQPDQIYRPGTTPAYSNYSNALAAYVVERVSGQPYAAYVDANIVQRLRLKATTYAQPLPEELAGHMSSGYMTADARATPFETIGVSPAGSLSSTAADMAVFMSALLPTGLGSPLMKRETAVRMQAPALSAETLGTMAGGDRMGIGFFGETRGGRRVVGHDGDTAVFHSTLRLYPAYRVGIFASLNSTGVQGGAGALRTELTDGFADRYFPEREPPATLPTSAEHAEVAAGTYQPTRRSESTFIGMQGAFLTVTLAPGRDGTLVMAGPRPTEFREVEEWVWQQINGPNRLAMRVDDGKVSTVTIASYTAIDRLPVLWTVAPLALGLAGAVLLLTVIAWPIGAIVRRRHRYELPLNRGERRARLLTHLAALLALVAALAWLAGGVLVQLAMNPLPGLFRIPQVLSVLAILGVVPATVQLVRAIARWAGFGAIAWHVLVLLSLGAFGVSCLVLNLLSLSATY